MDSKYITPFIDSTINTFKELFREEITVKKPFYMDKNEIYHWDITAIIGIAGDAKGAVLLSFKEDVAIFLTSRLTENTVEQVTDEVIDTIGELVNIISGNAKKGLEEYRLMISLPSIIKGTNFGVVLPTKNLPIIVIPFEMSRGIFHLSVCLENIIG